MNKRLWLGACAGLGLGAGTAGADVWYVATNGSDGAAGTTWETAYATIGYALTQAAAGDNNEVWVSNGTYALGAQLSLTKGVRVWGAYGAGATVLDGGKSIRCVYMYDGILDGFTVTNGHAAAGSHGGGVYAETGQVLNCTLAGNWAHAYGGGVYGKAGGVGVVSNCVIAGNSATNTAGYGGGGAYVAGPGWQVLDCPSINDNIAVTYGGGVYITGGGVISNCVLSHNICIVVSGVFYGGGLYVNDRAQAIGCLVASNICDIAGNGRGGGIYVANTGMVVNCTVRGNVSGENGGGICALYGIVKNCPDISGNRTALTGTKRGGGLYLYSGCRVSDCTIRNNTARFGAGLSSGASADIIVSNCVIADNITTNETGGAEGNDTGMILRNCLITRNVSVFGAGGINMYDGEHSRIVSGKEGKKALAGVLFLGPSGLSVGTPHMLWYLASRKEVDDARHRIVRGAVELGQGMAGT